MNDLDDTSDWVKACGADDVDLEDVIPVEIHGHQYAVYRSRQNAYFATDGYCTHERFPLAAGFVMGTTIECAKHNGTFNYQTGEGLEAPVCVDLKTYPVRVEDGTVFIRLD
jgi:3-phenylpropionate/trans-cinnamate dioxygenase ferredoxin component